MQYKTRKDELKMELLIDTDEYRNGNQQGVPGNGRCG